MARVTTTASTAEWAQVDYWDNFGAGGAQDPKPITRYVTDWCILEGIGDVIGEM